MIIPQNRSKRLIKEVATTSGSKVEYFSIENDTLIVTASVTSISGTLDIVVSTIDDNDVTLDVITFPQLSGTTSELVLKKAASCLNNLKVTVTYSDACEYVIHGKGINTGEASTKVLGVGSATVTRVSVDTSTVPATTLITSALTDRSGLIIKNTSSTATIDIDFVDTVTADNGYPLSPGEAIAMDIDSGVALYGVSSSGTISIAIIEGGA